ncbi:acyl carrier protein [Enhygromyxa salina]|uniref:Acyl carrier protein n=1 Tax=Enhygromyxa salina TaxID=215803 RepID=A0A2S9YL41_9BACT|nr:acyl carrier protein [Enhygromyxa salina]PRQ05837.1 acyl carrier protein [Enhygromyxa salina]
MNQPTDAVATRISAIIIERLELEDFTVEDFPRDAILFAPDTEGGLDLDSIASLEIVSALADEYDLDFDEIAREDFMSVETLAAYIIRELAALGRQPN